MPHAAATMSEGSAKSAPPRLTSLASATDCHNSYNSACTAETTEELQVRLAEIAKCAPVARSSQEPVSYNSAITADCEQDLAARLEGIARLHPPGPMHQQLGTSSSQAAAEPSPVCEGNINSASVSTFPLPAAIPVPIIAPVYPMQWLGMVNPASFLGYSLPASSHSTMPTEIEASRPAEGPTRRRSRSQHSRRTPIVVVDEMETTQGSSQRNNVNASTGDARAEPTEEQWEERFRKRQDGIKNMKSSPIYYEHKDFPHKVLKLQKRPRTPDVYNRNFSKRKWEEESAKWRAAWREIDGVACLVDMCYPEKSSQKAWRKVTEQLKDGEDLRRKQLQKDKKNKQGNQADVFFDKADHKVSLERAHQKHKEQAIAILCA